MQRCPLCTNEQVINCLEASALDLGAKGRDDYFGYGLVQVDATYRCLVGTATCCGDAPGPAPSPAPSTETGCPRFQAAYEECVTTKLSGDQWRQCVTCFNSQFPNDSVYAECSDVSLVACRASLLCKGFCGECLTEVESYLHCMVEVETGVCSIDCSRATSPEAAPYYTIGASPTAAPTEIPSLLRSANASSPVEVPIGDDKSLCAMKWNRFQTCLSAALVPLRAEACQFCGGIIGSRKLNRTADCDLVKTIVCSSLEDCDCDQCAAYAADVFACELTLLSAASGNGTCEIVTCQNEQESLASASHQRRGVSDPFYQALFAVVTALGAVVLLL